MVRPYDASAACVEELRRTCVSDGRSLAKQRTQNMKADLVTQGILTQARADEIFS